VSSPRPTCRRTTRGRRAITHIDDRTGRTIAQIRVPEGGVGLHSAFIAGALWVTGLHVWRIAAATNRPRRAGIRRADVAFDASASAGRLWLRRTGGRAAAVDPKRVHDDSPRSRADLARVSRSQRQREFGGRC